MLFRKSLATTIKSVDLGENPKTLTTPHSWFELKVGAVLGEDNARMASFALKEPLGQTYLVPLPLFCVRYMLLLTLNPP